MYRSPAEAAIVAIVALMLYFALRGGIPAPQRFNVRTLMVGMTLIALLLGIIAYAARH